MATFYPRVQQIPSPASNILHRRINPVHIQQPAQQAQPIRVSTSSLLSNSQVFQNPFFPSNQNSVTESPIKLQNTGFVPSRGLPHSQSNGTIILMNQQAQRRLAPQQSLPMNCQHQIIKQPQSIQQIQIQKQLAPQLINKTQHQTVIPNKQIILPMQKQVIVGHNQQQQKNQQQVYQPAQIQVKPVFVVSSEGIDKNQAQCLQEIKMSQKLLSQIKGLIPKKQSQSSQIKPELSNKTNELYQTGDYKNYQNNFVINQQQIINQITVDPIQPGIRYIAPYTVEQQPNYVYESEELQPPQQQNISHNTSQDAHQIIYNNQPVPNTYFSFVGGQAPQQQQLQVESPQIAYPSNYYKIEQLQQIVFGDQVYRENRHEEQPQQMDEQRINQQLFRSQNQIPPYQQNQNTIYIQQPQFEPQNTYYEQTYQQQVQIRPPNQIYHSSGLRQQTQQQMRIRRSKIYQTINAGVQQLKRQSHSKRSSHSNSRNPNFMMYLDGIDLLSYYDLHQRLLKDKDELAVLYQQSFGTGHN